MNTNEFKDMALSLLNNTGEGEAAIQIIGATMLICDEGDCLKEVNIADRALLLDVLRNFRSCGDKCYVIDSSYLHMFELLNTTVLKQKFEC